MKKILLCVSGMSPAIVTETLYALIHPEPPETPWIPDEIHIITTMAGLEKIDEELLTPETGQFYQLMRDYLPGSAIRFGADTLHTIKASETALNDIVSDADNKAAGDSIYRIMRELKGTKDAASQLHVSIAGGRKSMSFYIGHSFSLLADHNDTLSHVLVNEPFDNPALKFYFPPKQPIELVGNNRGAELKVNTADARVTLATLSVLRLGKLFQDNWPDKAKQSFDLAVRLAQDALVAPVMALFLNDQRRGVLHVSGEDIHLSPQQFMVFAIFALAKKHASELPEQGLFKLDDMTNDFWKDIADKFFDVRFDETKKMNGDVILSKINDKLKTQIGAVAEHFKIEAIGRIEKGTKGTGVRRPYAIKASAECLNTDALPRSWLSALQENL